MGIAPYLRDQFTKINMTVVTQFLGLEICVIVTFLWLTPVNITFVELQ
jgi:hypothetical protein